MRLRRDGWIARMYFFSLRFQNEHYRVRDELERGSDLCRVARRILFMLPLQMLWCSVLVSVPLIFLLVLGITVWKHWFKIIDFFPPWTLLIPFGIAEAIAVYLYAKWNEDVTEVAGAVGEWVHAKKSRYCPRVEFAESLRSPKGDGSCGDAKGG